ncbi:MAG: hypothetical protein OEQ53_17785 [Saprospiraceae bacterium]|nr:hypothetical protein [Saprospiraceae bacterium]
MEYLELIQLWDTSDNSDINISLNKKALNELTTKKLKSGIVEIKWSSIIEIIVTSIWIIFLVTFITEYLQDIKLLLSAIILIVISIFSLIIEINKLYLYYSIDHNFSVFQAQKRIEKLKFLEKLDINSLYLLIPLFFVPFVLVFTKGILHIDLFELGFSGYEMTLSILGSIIIAIVMVLVLRKSQFKSLNESLEFLKDISQQ